MRFAQGTDFSPGSPARARLDAFQSGKPYKPKPINDTMNIGGGGPDIGMGMPKPKAAVQPPTSQPFEMPDNRPVAPTTPATPANCPPAARPPRMAGQQLEANTPAKPKADVQAQPVVTPRQEAEVQLEQAAASGANTDKPKAALENIIKQEVDVKQDAIDMEFIRRCGNGDPKVACVRPGPGGRPRFDYAKFREQVNANPQKYGAEYTKAVNERYKIRQQKAQGPAAQPVEDGPRAMPQFPDANRRNNEKPIDSSRREPIWKQLQSRYIKRQEKRPANPVTSNPDEIATVINQLRRGTDMPIVSRPR